MYVNCYICVRTDLQDRPGIRGYWYTAPRPLTDAQVDTVKDESNRFEQAKTRSEPRRERARDPRYPTAPPPPTRLTDYNPPARYSQPEHRTGYGATYNNSDTYYPATGRGESTMEQPYSERDYSRVSHSTQPTGNVRSYDETAPHYVVVGVPPNLSLIHI